MSWSLLKMITDRAMETYTGPKGKDGIKQWYLHWIDIAEQYRDSFYKEGLVNSADHVCQMIAEQKAFMRLEEL